MKTDDISLNEFLELVFIRMYDLSMDLPHDQKKWHKALRKVSRSGDCRVKTIKELFFESDGPYHTCPDFTEAFGHFTSSGCLLIIPHDSYAIEPELIDVWRKKFRKDIPLPSVRRCVVKMVAALKFEAAKGVKSGSEAKMAAV